jgi:hypothetical protein
MSVRRRGFPARAGVIRFLIVGWVLTGAVYSRQPDVTNLRAARIQETTKVEILYDLQRVYGKPMIGLKVHGQSGKRIDISELAISGDVGEGVTAGTDKRIVCDLGEEWDRLAGSIIRFDLIAAQARSADRAGVSSVKLRVGRPAAKPGSDDTVKVGGRSMRRFETLIPGTPKGRNVQANLAVLDNGEILVTWNGQGRCHGQRYDASGEPVGEGMLLDQGSGWGPAPAPLPNGGFVVAHGQSGSASPSYGQCFDVSGVPVGEAFAVGLPDWLTVGSNHPGDFIAAGTRGVVPITDDMPVMARRFNPRGKPYGPPFQVGEETHGRATVSTSYGTDGRFAFAWPNRTGRKAMVRAYRSDEDSPFGPETAANSESAQGGMVSARYNSRNELFVVWAGASPGKKQGGVFLRRFDANMIPVGEERRLNTASKPKGWSTCLSIGPNDDMLVTWDAADGNIDGVLLDPSGTVRGQEFRINAHTGGERTLGWEACQHTAVLANGSLVVGWAGQGATGNGIHLTVFKPAPVLPNFVE